MIRIFSYSVYSDTYPVAVVSAAAALLTPNIIFLYARISFLIVLSATLAVIVFLVYLQVIQPPTIVTTKLSSDTDKFDYSFSFTDDDFPEIPPETDSIKKENTGTVPLSESAANESGRDESEKKNQDIDTPENDSSISNEQTSSVDNCTNQASIEPVKPADPMGLFSSTTGFGWQSYLEPRLDAELIRSASIEQDLALVIIRIPELDTSHPVMKKICTILLDCFKFRDLVFEYGSDGFAGILQNTDLDNAMIIAETVHAEFSAAFANCNLSYKTIIGISTRSLRLITGDRVIIESEQAVERGLEESGMPIVAFKVNPEKYRSFLSDSIRHIIP
jgi:GGDEF domain-containing protein